MMFGVAGCGSGNMVGTATSASAPSESESASFDPCALPDDAIRAVGANPASKNAGIFGVEYPDWKICTWPADWNFVSIMATNLSLDRIRSNPRNVDIAPVDIAGRAGFTYHEAGGNGQPVQTDQCDVAYQIPDGALLIRASKKGSRDALEDPCVATIRNANVLDRYIPR